MKLVMLDQVDDASAAAARDASHAQPDAGNIISVLEKMIGITPAWLIRRGK